MKRLSCVVVVVVVVLARGTVLDPMCSLFALVGGDAPAEGVAPREHREAAGGGFLPRQETIRCAGEFLPSFLGRRVGRMPAGDVQTCSTPCPLTLSDSSLASRALTLVEKPFRKGVTHVCLIVGLHRIDVTPQSALL